MAINIPSSVDLIFPGSTNGGLGGRASPSPVDNMSAPQLKNFLKRAGFNPQLLNTPFGLNSALRAWKQKLAPGRWEAIFSAENPGQVPGNYGNFVAGAMGTGGAAMGTGGGGQSITFNRPQQGQRGSGIPSIGDIMNQLTSMVGGGAPASINLPNAPNFNAILKGMKPPKFNAKAIKNQIRSAYQPIIKQLNIQLKQGGLQTAQNQADISSWFGQVVDAAEEGRQRDIVALTASQTTLDNSIKGFISATGGGANPAAADMAKAGIAASAGLAQIGLAQANFDSNLESLIGLQATDAARAEKNRASQEALAIQQTLLQVKGQQKTDILNAISQGKQQAYENKLNYLSTAGSLAQQTFQNALTLAQLEFEVQNSQQATDPAALLASAIDIQYGLIRNAQLQREGQVDPAQAYLNELDIILKKQAVDKGQAEIQNIISGGSQSVIYTSKNPTTIINQVKKELEDTQFDVGKDRTIAAAQKVSTQLDSMLARYNLPSQDRISIKKQIMSSFGINTGPNGNPAPGANGLVYQ